MMEISKVLTEILSAAIRNREWEMDKTSKEAIDWYGIYNEACTHQVHTLIYPIIRSKGMSMGMDEKLLSIWNIAAMSCGMQMISDEVWLGEVVHSFQNSGIKAIVLKGMAIKSCYPYPELRTMGDADILVKEIDIDRASEILKEMGYTAEKDLKTKHIEFHKKNAISIELHRLLIDYDFMQKKENFHKEIWTDPVEISLGVEKAYALSWEFQVLHLCIHMAFHIIYGGFGLRQLCDLVLVVEKKGTQIDWDKVLVKTYEYGVEKFVYAIFNVCSKLFDMDVPIQLSRFACEDEVYINKLISDIFSSGNFGKKDRHRASANVLIKNLDEEYINPNNVLSKVRMLLFPSRKKLSSRVRYLYVKEHPLLLPVAWIQRIIYGIKRNDFDYSYKKAIFRDDNLVKVAQERNELLQWLGLK